jgi:flagellar M-ring protein FliF
VENLTTSLKNLGTGKLAALGGTALLMIVIFGFMMVKMGDTKMQTLYAGLDPADVNQIVAQLEVMKVPYKVAEDGKVISVVPESVGKVRLRMAEVGLPHGGNLGYEIFDKKEGFGTSNFVQNINKVRSLEGELGRTISSIDVVRNVRVHLVLPQRELFSRDKQPPSASVFLQIIGGQKLSKNQIAAIQQLVSSAVPELKPNAVAIIDDKGNLIARNTENESQDSVALENSEEQRVAFESRLKSQVETLLENVVGFGKARAQISTEMDFGKVTKSSETYDPESKVERSTQTVQESDLEAEKAKNTSVENNIPEGQSKTDADANKRQQNRTEETVNYEISKVVKNEIVQTGTIKRISVAILLDGNYTKVEKDGKTEMVYAPRDQKEIEQITTLVKSAIGFDAKRGDTVEVVNMRFASLTDGVDVKMSFWEKIDITEYSKIVETLIMALMGLMVLLLVIRPMMNKLLTAASVEAGVENSNALLAASGLVPALEAPDGSTLPANPSEIEEMLSLERIDGQMKASTVKRIGEIIDTHPEEAIQIIRNWMNQEA